jgi:hypothetical protein
VPTSHYQDFATRAGCYKPGKKFEAAVFDCLVNSDTNTLQYASANVSIAGEWGTWAFQPVIDGDFIRELPSKQLRKKKVSGKRVLSGVSSLCQNLVLSLEILCANPSRTMPTRASRLAHHT